MGDACGCGDDLPSSGESDSTGREPERLWEVSEIRFAAVSGVSVCAKAATRSP